MTRMPREWGRLLRSAAVLGMLGSGPYAPAQDDPGEQQVAVPRPQPILMTDQEFHSYVFAGGDGRPDGFENRLAIRIAELDRVCGLSEGQRMKLRLAGRGDIKRFFDRVEVKRREFHAVRRDQEKLSALLRSIRPMRVSPASEIFDDGSLFSKALKSTLSAEQAATYREGLRKQSRARWQGTVDRVIAGEDRALKMSDRQKQEFTKALLEGTRPPERPSPYDYYIVLFQASRMPEERIRPIFDPRQWEALNRRFDHARRMGSTLLDAGLLP